MTIQKINPGALPATIIIPPSKSYANRALILGALKGNIRLENVPDASDVTFLVSALKEAGLHISQAGNKISILNSFPDCEKTEGAEIHVGEGGTTARFLACLLIQGKAPYTLVLGDRLKDRPWQTFIDLVKRYGGQASLEGHALKLQGPLKLTDSIEVDASLTTQFASGLQMALAWTSIKVIPLHLKSSLSYWQMTEWLIAQIKASSVFTIPADWSSASYPLAFASLNQSIQFPGLKVDSLQADFKICAILKAMNCLRIDNDSVKVEKWTPKKLDINIDVHDCLDLFPTLAYLASHIEGKHAFTGISNLVHKESNRLHEIILLLTRFGIKTETKGSDLIIYGDADLAILPQNLKLPDDHRMVMTAALFLRHHQGGEISPAEAVQKSYPTFWQLLN